MSTDPSMIEGRDCANHMMQVVKMVVESSPDPVLWWAGFLGVILGSMTASVGSEAVSIVTNAMKPEIEELAKNHEH